MWWRRNRSAVSHPSWLEVMGPTADGRDRKTRSDTLRVFLYAPREDKVRRLLARGKSEKEAEELVDSIDRERAHFIQKYFNVEWPDRAIYHTMINTLVGDEAVVHMILDSKE